MRVILGEDLTGWLAAAVFLFGGLGASILALCALVPASRDNRPLTLGLIAPAMLMFLWVTCWLAHSYFLRENPDREELIENYVEPWFLMALPPLITGLLPCFVLWFKKRKQE
jgi:hypothetical protein